MHNYSDHLNIALSMLSERCKSTVLSNVNFNRLRDKLDPRSPNFVDRWADARDIYETCFQIITDHVRGTL